jgi:hypothetical protein
MPEQLGHRGQVLLAVALDASNRLVKVIVVFPDGSTHALGEQQPTQTVLGLKRHLAMVSSARAESQHLFILDDQRDAEDLELKDDETVEEVLTYSASTTELQLGVVAGDNAAWENLTKLRDATGYTTWQSSQEGWSMLEEHQDPSQCAGVEMDVNDVASLNLSCSNLTGGGWTLIVPQ